MEAEGMEADEGGGREAGGWGATDILCSHRVSAFRLQNDRHTEVTGSNSSDGL